MSLIKLCCFCKYFHVTAEDGKVWSDYTAESAFSLLECDKNVQESSSRTKSKSFVEWCKKAKTCDHYEVDL